MYFRNTSLKIFVNYPPPPSMLETHTLGPSLVFFHTVQWNPSCEATPFEPEKWPFKRGGHSSGVEINTFMFRFTLSSGLSRGGGLSSGWPLKRGSTVVDTGQDDLVDL